MNTHTILLTALFALGLGTQSAQAQNDSKDSYPHTFIGLQGGAGWTFYDKTSDVAPVGAFQVGGYFNPYVGLRGKLYGWKNEVDLKDLGQDLEYKYLSTSVDVLVNLSNIIAPEHKLPLDFGVFAGCGPDFSKATTNPYSYVKPMWQGAKKNVGLHVNAGAMMDWKINRHVNLNLEVGGHYLGDRMKFYSKSLGEWQVTTMLGVVYKFKSERKHKSVNTAINAMQNYNNSQNANMATAQQPTAQANPAKEPAPQPQPQKVEPVKKVVKAESLTQTIFFTIGSSAIRSAESEKVATLAQWMNQHPNTCVNIVGYADAGTGSPSVNMNVAKQRANRIAKTLIQKYNISNDRINVVAKGDTEQPFSENDQNRVVIAVAK